MCSQCWRNYGSPGHTSPEIERAVVLIARIYATESTGAPLHAELDDWNIDGDWQPSVDRDDLADPAAWDVAVELCELVRGLPVADRAAALARHDGFLPQT